MLLRVIVRVELNRKMNVVEVEIRPEHETRMDGKTRTFGSHICRDGEKTH